MELWKEIPGSDGGYWVSSLGRVRGPRKLLSPGLGHNGYQLVSIRRDGVRITARVHRLVAEMFVPGYIEGFDACHIDGDKTNSVAGNLKWGSRSENIIDQVLLGRHRNARKTQCPQGHEYTPENTYLSPRGDRNCRECRVIAQSVKPRAPKRTPNLAHGEWYQYRVVGCRCAPCRGWNSARVARERQRRWERSSR